MIVFLYKLYYILFTCESYSHLFFLTLKYVIYFYWVSELLNDCMVNILTIQIDEMTIYVYFMIKLLIILTNMVTFFFNACYNIYIYTGMHVNGNCIGLVRRLSEVAEIDLNVYLNLLFWFVFMFISYLIFFVSYIYSIIQMFIIKFNFFVPSILIYVVWPVVIPITFLKFNFLLKVFIFSFFVVFYFFLHIYSYIYWFFSMNLILKVYLFCCLFVKFCLYYCGFLFLFIVVSYFCVFFVLFFFGSYIGIYGALSFIILNNVFSLICVLLIFVNLIKNLGFFVFYTEQQVVFLLNWSWVFICDSLTISMFFIIVVISFLVQLYSVSYMRYDPHLIRFLALLSLFTFCMLFLVSSGNVVQLFFGWEGVGLCSYLLINFWFTRIQANKAAIKAMIVNKIGDISLLVFIALFYYVYGSFDLLVVDMLSLNYQYAYVSFGGGFDIHLFSLFSLLLLIAAIGKSAQLGLHTWLPDAMEGPTPVSALIHAATMVTAGVFLIIRFNFFFELSLVKQYIICFIGCFTALFGSCVAFFQNDIKKVIAYSTCSQLGYMFVACGLSRYDLALFHLVNHAFFKALLFLSAGVIIHGFSNEQDMRKMGGLSKFFSFTYLNMLIASFALMGLPFFSGFYSKELIFEIAFSTFTFYGFFSYLLLLFSAFFTAAYSIRLLYMVFWTRPNGFFRNYLYIKECSYIICFVFICLFFLTLFFGYFSFDLFVGCGSSFFFDVILIKPYKYNIYFDFEYILLIYKLLPFFFSLFGMFFGYYICKNSNILFENRFFYWLTIFCQNKWYFDYIYNNISYFFLNFGYMYTYKQIDKNLLELFGPTGIFYFLNKLSFFNRKVYNSYIYVYINLFFGGIVIILLLFNNNFDFLCFFFFCINYLIVFYIFKGE